MTTKELKENIRNRYDKGRYTWFYTKNGDFIVKDKTSDEIYAIVKKIDDDPTDKIDELMEFVENANNEDSYYLIEMKKFMNEA